MRKRAQNQHRKVFAAAMLLSFLCVLSAQGQQFRNLQKTRPAPAIPQPAAGKLAQQPQAAQPAQPKDPEPPVQNPFGAARFNPGINQFNPMLNQPFGNFGNPFALDPFLAASMPFGGLNPYAFYSPIVSQFGYYGNAWGTNPFYGGYQNPYWWNQPGAFGNPFQPWNQFQPNPLLPGQFPFGANGFPPF